MIYNDKQIEQIRLDSERLHARVLNTNPGWLKAERERQARYDESIAMTEQKERVTNGSR